MTWCDKTYLFILRGVLDSLLNGEEGFQLSWRALLRLVLGPCPGMRLRASWWVRPQMCISNRSSVPDLLMCPWTRPHAAPREDRLGLRDIPLTPVLPGAAAGVSGERRQREPPSIWCSGRPWNRVGDSLGENGSNTENKINAGSQSELPRPHRMSVNISKDAIHFLLAAGYEKKG